jgi:hypothetical protein
MLPLPRYNKEAGPLEGSAFYSLFEKRIQTKLREVNMTSRFYHIALMGVALGAFASVPMLYAQPSPAGNVKDAVMHAKEAVDHGKQGHAEALVTHAEKSRNHAERGGKNSHLNEAINHLTEAIEHGKAGHADVATQHAETALTHLTEVK